MFEDVERIEGMTVDEYNEALYYFKHPDEYEGDFDGFRDKVMDYAERIEDHTDTLPSVYTLKKRIKTTRAVREDSLLSMSKSIHNCHPERTLVSREGS